jgi:hypothetical protein
MGMTKNELLTALADAPGFAVIAIKGVCPTCDCGSSGDYDPATSVRLVGVRVDRYGKFNEAQEAEPPLRVWLIE